MVFECLRVIIAVNEKNLIVSTGFKIRHYKALRGNI